MTRSNTAELPAMSRSPSLLIDELLEPVSTSKKYNSEYELIEYIEYSSEREYVKNVRQ